MGTGARSPKCPLVMGGLEGPDRVGVDSACQEAEGGGVGGRCPLSQVGAEAIGCLQDEEAWEGP